MKRIVFTLVCVLLVLLPVSVFAAAQEEVGEEVVTLNWWTINSEDYTAEVQTALAREFEKVNPNIKVEVTVLPSSGFGQKMNTALAAGEGGPDLAFFWTTAWYPEALDLTPYIERDNFDTSQYIKSFWDTRAVAGDKVVGLPLGVGASLVMYNKDMFDAAGVSYPENDWTVYDYLELVKQLENPDKKVWGGDAPRKPFRALWFNFDAQPYSDDSMTVDGYINGDGMVEAYTWLWDLVDTGAVPSTADLATLSSEGTGPVDLFLAGRLAMATLNQGHMLTAIESGVRFGVVPEPQVAGNNRYANLWSLTSSIWKGTEHPDEAWEFLKYWVGSEGQRFFMNKGHFFPSISSVLAEYKDSDKDYVQGFYEVLNIPQCGEWLGTHLSNGTVARAIQDVWDKVILQMIDRDEIRGELEAVLPAAQKALDESRERLGN
ncbi:MAG: sugar ABC transporter substrate-binding protein [Bacteroidetes bacterium]|nr:sugar ABC transporter substrate-binding protein [Bacteroidota bacterium]